MKYLKFTYILVLLLVIACNMEQGDKTGTEEPETVYVEKPLPIPQEKETVYVDEKPDPELETDKEWTSGIVNKQHDITGAAIITVLRYALHDDYERIVLEFDKEIPSWHIEYIDEPFHQCGSGEQVWLEGDGLLEIRMEPAAAHTDAGEATLDRNQIPDLKNVRQIMIGCDFEANVSLLIGVASPNEYSVMELQEPPRLVIDIQR